MLCFCYRFEIRVCILNVFDAPLQESNFAGEKMSDLYVKGWLQGTDNVRKTDIHYRYNLKTIYFIIIFFIL